MNEKHAHAQSFLLSKIVDGVGSAPNVATNLVSIVLLIFLVLCNIISRLYVPPFGNLTVIHN